MKAMLVLLVALASCQGWNDVNNPVSKEYPCGTRAHMCSSGGCCWNTDDCGGDVASCPADLCCYKGTEWGTSADAGTRTKQWRP